MDVLVNATTLVKGGGIQVAASFIVESLRDPAGIRWHYALSGQVLRELEGLGAVPDEVHLFEKSPARDRAQRRRLRALERRIAPDVVFTVFGPAYVRFAAPHLLGVAVCWVTHSTWLAYRTLPGWGARFRTLLSCLFKGAWLWAADEWVVEATNARDGMRRRMLIPPERVRVVPNSCAGVFIDAHIPPAPPPAPGETVRLLYVSAYYPHKNFEFVPDVAAALKERDPGRDYEFVITLPEDEPGLGRVMDKARRLGVESMVRNVGRVSLPELIRLYESMSLCFMPSLLETFSATYPEAMAVGRPVVTSDLDFARAVCADAAVYFRPNDAESAADAIAGLVADPGRWSQSIEKGRRVLSQLPDARGKYEGFIEAIAATAKQG